MKIVHSFWSKPMGGADLRTARIGWPTPVHLWCSWAYSALVSRENYGRLELVADTEGVNVLADRLELPYDTVRDDLDDLDVDPHLWMSGKLRAYELQDEPFWHIDGDAYLTRRLPDEYHGAEVVVQMTEYGTDVMAGYAAFKDFDHFAYRLDGWSEFARDHRAYNVGIFGGTNVAAINDYARQALRMITAPENAAAWELVRQQGSKVFWTANATVEQVGAYCYFNGHRVSVTPMLYDYEWKDRVRVGRDRGFTHMMSARFDKEKADRVVIRLRDEYPEYYQRVLDYVGANEVENLGVPTPKPITRTVRVEPPRAAKQAPINAGCTPCSRKAKLAAEQAKQMK